MWLGREVIRGIPAGPWHAADLPILCALARASSHRMLAGHLTSHYLGFPSLCPALLLLCPAPLGSTLGSTSFLMMPHFLSGAPGHYE